ncbi:MAG: hypothetical protein IPN14_08680 [Bacteroidetes bacterium]|nr:hypothetical protein [Bacteroidota bacterium]
MRTITGFYYDSLVSNSGCDSLITLFLTLNYSTFTFSDSAPAIPISSMDKLLPTVAHTTITYECKRMRQFNHFKSDH